MKRPTMRDVANKAGVSTATVSHVINRTRFVREETRQSVLQAIADLGYRPSSVARSLTTKRTQTVGVLLSSVSNPFFAEVLCGIEDTLMPEGYSIVICNTGETFEREAHHLDVLLRQRVDGIIAAAASRRWDILTEVEEQISAARRAYNASLTYYNNSVEMVPTNVVAKLFDFSRKRLFEIEPAEREAVDVHAMFQR